jgi:hypothetical protein
MLDATLIRRRSIAVANRLGYVINPALPLLDETQVTRSTDQIVDRLLAMHSVAAAAYGFDRSKARDWLSRQVHSVCLTPEEQEFLESHGGDPRPFMWQIESMWGLAWAICVVDTLDFGQRCSQDFVRMLPDLKSNGDAGGFRQRATLRSDESIVAMADLAYCLCNSIVDESLKGTQITHAVPAYVIFSRRRALEWLLTDDDWNSVSMDT